VSNATAWWGLRGYSAAVSNGTTKAINLRASGNNATSDFVILSNGALDVASISTFLTTNGGSLFVTELYDQTGNGNHLTQATAANQPGFSLSVLGSFAAINVTGSGSGTIMGTSSISYSSTLTMSHVAQFTNSTSDMILGGPSGENFRFVRANVGGTANVVNINGGGTDGANVSSTNSTWRAWQSLYNGTSSILYQDGSSNAESLSALTAGSNFFSLFNRGGLTGFNWIGYFMETGMWNATLFTGGQAGSMNSNQHNYYGF
jgi:hypothetical protein